MRCKLLLFAFLLSLILPFFLFAQDTSSINSKTETTSLQGVEKSGSQDEEDVSKKEQKEDVIIEEESEEDIIEEEDITKDVITEEDIIEEASEKETPKKEVTEEDISEEPLEKEEPKEEVIAEEPKEGIIKEEDVTEEDIIEGVSDKEKPVEEVVAEDEKIDTVKSPSVTPEEGIVKEIEESVEGEKGAEEEKDTVSEEAFIEEEDMDIILEEDEGLLIVDDKEEFFITDEPAESTVVEEKLLKEKDDTVTAEVTPSEETGEQPQKEEALVPSELEVIEEEISTEKPEVAIGGIPDKGKPPVTTTIERARSIDFAKNLKDYRSPKKAMFMSLLLPGLGQAYTKKYWKTALFGAIEASLVGFAVKNAVDGRDKMEDARNFADDHYIVQDFFKFYEDFITFVSPESIDVDIEIVFGDSLSNYKEKFTNITGKSHDVDERKDFDKFIGDDESPFVQGWDDCEPSFSSAGYNLTDTLYSYNYKYFSDDTLWVISRYINDTVLVKDGIYGYSKNQGKYADMISQSNRFYDVSRYLIFFLVANHVVSAVDAFISARAFNDKLLHKESFWQRIDIDHQVAFAQDGFHSRLGIRVRF